MKQIEAIQTWANGQNKTADHFSLRIINDDLKSSCTFYYELLHIENEEDRNITDVLATGNLSLLADEYDAWDGNNDYAYTWAASQLNLVII